MNNISRTLIVYHSVEQSYNKLLELTHSLNKYIEEKNIDEILLTLDQREQSIAEINKFKEELDENQKEIVSKLKSEKFSLSILESWITENEYLELTKSLNNIQTILRELISLDQVSINNAKMFFENIKLQMSRVQSIKGVRKAYSHIGAFIDPRLIDQNR